MKKALFLAVITAFLVGVPGARAEEVQLAEAAEVKAESAGILPTNPYYFMKRFGWGIRRFFAFDPVRKLELEFERLDELAAEVKKMSTLDADAELIDSELRNYQSGLESLRVRLETFSRASGDRRLKELLERVIIRQSVFKEEAAS